MTTGARYAPTLGDARCWPASVRPAPSAPGTASALLARSIEQGATIAAIGALTNLARLVQEKPGILTGVPVVVMGGWFGSPRAGTRSGAPTWTSTSGATPDAAEIVLDASAAEVTLVPLSVAIRAASPRRRARPVARGRRGRCAAGRAVGGAPRRQRLRRSRPRHPALPGRPRQLPLGPRHRRGRGRLGRRDGGDPDAPHPEDGCGSRPRGGPDAMLQPDRTRGRDRYRRRCLRRERLLPAIEAL